MKFTMDVNGILSVAADGSLVEISKHGAVIDSFVFEGPTAKLIQLFSTALFLLSSPTNELYVLGAQIDGTK